MPATPITPIAVVVSGRVHLGTYIVLGDDVVVSSANGIQRRRCAGLPRTTALELLRQAALHQPSVVAR